MIVDDRASVRKGLTTFLESLEDMELIAEASNGAEAIQLCKAVHPDVILMDLEMPEMDGIAATRAIHDNFPHMHIIILTTSADEGQTQAALQAGAFSCVLKDVSAHTLANTIRSTRARSNHV